MILRSAGFFSGGPVRARTGKRSARFR